MKTLHTIIAAAAAAVLAANAMAQVPYSTDEARALAAKASAESALEQAFEPPAFEPVAPGDYRAAARNEGRIARFADFHRSLQAHMDGERSAPIAVVSEVSAREEASRQRNEHDMDRHAAYLKTSLSAWMIHREVVGESGSLAQR